MNNDRRKTINQILNKVKEQKTIFGKLKNDIEVIRDKEQEARKIE